VSSEHPILFSAPMVNAILEGRKSQTRRIVKRNKCPYGEPGDRLWVRETWAHYQTINSIRRYDGASSSQVSDGLAGYKADGFDTIEDFREHVRAMSGLDLEEVEINGNRWRPSIHMPRWASRITLCVTDVGMERLQAIGEYDCEREGVGHAMPQTGKQRYAELWDSINGKGSWATNPWVWVVAFQSTSACGETPK
jgi:hypothetical protein